MMTDFTENAGYFDITKLFKRLGHNHCLRVDEGEEEDISSLLLVGIELGLSVIIIVFLLHPQTLT